MVQIIEWIFRQEAREQDSKEGLAAYKERAVRAGRGSIPLAASPLGGIKLK
jgi:hypothetical protein